VKNVEAHIARMYLTQDGVQVGAVVIEQTPGVMDDGGNFRDAPIEQTVGRRIGHHERRRLWPDRCAQRVDIGVAIIRKRHLANCETTHYR
jgi:hypothetical protein